MHAVSLDPEGRKRLAQTLAYSPLFRPLAPDALARVIGVATVLEVAPGDSLVHEGQGVADAFFVVVAGELSMRSAAPGSPEPVELARVKPPEIVGLLAAVTTTAYAAQVVALAKSYVLRFEAEALGTMIERVPGFGAALARHLATKLSRTSRDVPLAAHDPKQPVEARPDALALLPNGFCERWRVAPLRRDGDVITFAVVDEPTPALVVAVRRQAAGDPAFVRVTADAFRPLLEQRAGLEAEPDEQAPAARAPAAAAPAGDSRRPSAPPGRASVPLPPEMTVLRKAPKLDPLLRRMIDVRASDLHLSAGQKPRWRIDGDIHEISEFDVLGQNEVYEWLEPVMVERHRLAFAEENDADFSYAIANLARFRVNLFRDKGGVGAVLRVIPSKILSFEALGLPPQVRGMCEHPKGLVLVTGPTGSGKSTTLAAMIDSINRTRRSHVITLEDPIEFTHKSQLALINQREIGNHTRSYHRALKAALREDPDIVLVGELRDLETVSLAVETANTGHLVFGTLHTSTATSTIDRVIDLFPHEQQNQVRSGLAESLKGVVAQTLCRKVGGGRVAALETLVVTYAVANLIREGKTFQIPSTMAMSKRDGNVLLNEELARLVTERLVTTEEAFTKCMDKNDLAKRLGLPPPVAEGASAPPRRT